jgi:hypothetical protein
MNTTLKREATKLERLKSSFETAKFKFESAKIAFEKLKFETQQKEETKNQEWFAKQKKRTTTTVAECLTVDTLSVYADDKKAFLRVRAKPFIDRKYARFPEQCKAFICTLETLDAPPKILMTRVQHSRYSNSPLLPLELTMFMERNHPDFSGLMRGFFPEQHEFFKSEFEKLLGF